MKPTSTDTHALALDELLQNARELEADLLEIFGEDGGPHTGGNSDPDAPCTAAETERLDSDQNDALDRAFGIKATEQPATEDDALDRAFGTSAHKLTEDEALDRAFGFGLSEFELKQRSAQFGAHDAMPDATPIARAGRDAIREADRAMAAALGYDPDCPWGNRR